MAVSSCQIAHTLRQKWPEALRSLADRSDRFFPTGLVELDAFFPAGRGIPYGQLIEVTGGLSSGKTSLLFRFLAANSPTPGAPPLEVGSCAPAINGGPPKSRTIAYVDFGNSLCPDAAASSGIDLSRLLVVKPGAPPLGVGSDSPTINGGPPNGELPDLKTGLRSGELLLRDRHADIIIFDLAGHHTPLPIGLLHRLRLKAVRAKGLVVFLTQTENIIPASMTSLRLEVQHLDDHHRPCLITAVKSRLCAEGLRCRVSL